jgi:outer membrane protein OmpA-like peptidoglycan-associated protein
MRLTVTGKIVALLLILGVAVGAWRNWSKIAPRAADKKTLSVPKINLPTNNLPNTGNSGSVTSGFTTISSGGCPQNVEVRLLGYAWNAQMGMQLSSGGAQALAGSSMCKHGVNFHFARQDDNSKLQEALVTFATELSQGNPQPKKGAHFVTIMGDGGAAFVAGLNEALQRIGPEYQAKIVDAIGYSRGEDKFMGPVAWKHNPAASKGGVVAGVLRDGDWNIAQKWLGDNGLRTNPDEKTWDPDALNWVSANDYIDAVEKYVAGYSETRPVVRNGQRTGETKRITVNGVVTWTPGDVTLAQKKGGLVSIVSTKEYSSQMPCVVIGINKWCQENRSTVENMILAIAEGGRQIKTNPAALRQGAKISAALYNEANAGPEYWEKYFKGTQERDATGQIVELGGSSVNDLADSMLSFGLLPGSANLVATTYTVFGDLVQSQYPELVPSFPSASQVLDASYLTGAAKRVALSKTAIAKAKPTYKASHRPAAVVSKRVWRIQFNAGKATFTPATLHELEQLSRQLLVAAGTVIEVHGHTDNQGDPRKSLPLSQARAKAVESWLEARAPVNFPQGRIRSFAHGESQPLYPNDSAAHRALNRRVEIVLRSA